jgi:hypothetical protein
MERLRAKVSDPAGPAWWRRATTVGAIVPALVTLPFDLSAAASLTALAIAWMFVAPLARPRLTARDAAVSIAGREVRLEGAGVVSQRLTAPDVVGAATAPTDAGVLHAPVRSWPGDPPVVLEVPGERDAARIRRALGIGAHGFGDVSWTWSRGRDNATATALQLAACAGWLAIAVTSAFGPIEVALGVLFPMLLLSVVVLSWIAAGRLPSVTLGSARLDAPGVSIEHASVTDARPDVDGVTVATATGERHLSLPGATEQDRAHLAALVKAAGRSARGPGASVTPPSVTPLARRTGESMQTWLHRIDGLAASMGDPGGYRSGGVEREELWATLEDPDASPALRAASARILARVAPEEARKRIADAVGVERDGPTRARIRVALEEDAEEAAAGLERLSLP